MPYDESKTVSLKGVKHGYIALSIGHDKNNGAHTFSTSDNVLLTSLYSQTATQVNVISLLNQYYEFMVKDYCDAMFTLTRGNWDDPRASAHMLIVCDK